MTATLPLALLVFFASGFAALLYQIIWQRMLAIFSGSDVYSVTVIVAAFMAGLGVGNLAGGYIADRLTRRTSLVLFGVTELTIGLFGAFSARLYYGFLYEQLGTWELGRGGVALLLFGSLLWPTLFMGASLPLLARAVTDRIESAALTVGALYGFNTLGAACGALVSTWVLLPSLGLEDSLRVGVWLNAGCAAALLPLVLRGAVPSRKGNGWPGVQPRQTGRDSSTGQGSPLAAPRGEGPPLGRAEETSFRWWLLAYALAGFIALSYEIVWFRLLGIMMKSTAFTFGSLLTLYLGGVGLGAAAASMLAAHARQPERLFFTLQAAAGLSAAFLLMVFVAVADDIRALAGYFAAYEPLNVGESVQALRAFSVPANFLRLYILVPLLIVVPPTLLMGCAFPVLQRVVQRDPARLGRHVGSLLLTNILGSILGAALTGWLSLSLLGTAGTLRLLVILSGIFLVCAWRHRGATGIAAALAVVAATVVLLPDAAGLWARLHGTEPRRMVFAEDNSGLSVIKSDRDDFQGTKVVFANGVGQSVLPYGDIHTALGALPVLVHPNPQNVAIIGLGSGDTVFAAAARGNTKRVVCIEIVGSQLTTLRAVAARDNYGGLQALLRDPRIEHRVDDGRAFLMRSGLEFDVIEADALRPTSAYSGNLYSEEYFTLLRNRLTPYGLAATWVPTRRVHDTFIKVFPYVVSVPGIMLGSSNPIDFTPATIAARLGEPRVRDHFTRAGIDIDALMPMYMNVTAGRFGPDFNRATLTNVNTDLFPRDEFDLSGSH